MQIPANTFRDALRTRQTQIGLWVGLADANAAELLATCGFDWLLFDGEHAPNNVRTVLDQLRAVAPYAVHAVVRPVSAEASLIKQYLDIGAQTLLVPMVDTAGQAEQIVRATRYAPDGIRGMGAALARASRWNQVEDYLNRANDEMCVLVQAETALAINNLRQIAEVEGVDGVFFGPADFVRVYGLSRATEPPGCPAGDPRRNPDRPGCGQGSRRADGESPGRPDLSRRGRAVRRGWSRHNTARTGRVGARP